MIDDIINHKDLSFVTRAIRFLNPIRAINSKKIIGENNAIKPFNILFKLFSKF